MKKTTRITRINWSAAPARHPKTRKAQVTDRAHRYRANQPGTRPRGPKRCALCKSSRNVLVDHKDGNEHNDAPGNLRWLCKRCNTIKGAADAKAGRGKRTVQYNPAKKRAKREAGGKGATSYSQWAAAVAAVDAAKGGQESFSFLDIDAARKLIHETPASKRREFQAETWRRRKERYGASGRRDGGAIPF